jgi:GNAT superfamily N-acetyltransferase
VREVSVVDEDLRTTLLRCWLDVSNAGGAVGFVPPVTEGELAPVLDKLLDGVRSGRNVLCVLEVDGEVGGWATLVRSDSHLRQHWASVLRVQVHPSRQGAGLGRALITGVHDIARRHGFEFLFLNVRGGTGTEAFYAGLGYVEVGRVPGALRLAPGDDRDEIAMVCRL